MMPAPSSRIRPHRPVAVAAPAVAAPAAIPAVAPATAPPPLPSQEVRIVFAQEPMAPASNPGRTSPPSGDNSFLKGLAAFAATVIGVVIVMVTYFLLFGGDNRQAGVNGPPVAPPIVNNWGRDTGFPGEGRSPYGSARRDPASPEARGWSTPSGAYRNADGRLCVKNNYGKEVCCLAGFTPRVVGQYPASKTYCDPPRRD